MKHSKLKQQRNRQITQRRLLSQKDNSFTPVLLEDKNILFVCLFVCFLRAVISAFGLTVLLNTFILLYFMSLSLAACVLK